MSRPAWLMPAALVAVGAVVLLATKRARASNPATSTAPRTTTNGAKSPKSGGIMLAAIENGTAAPISWVPIKMGDLTIEVASDATMAPVDGRMRRMPVTYAETKRACKAIRAATGKDCIVPSKRIADAMYAASNKLVFHGLVANSEDAAKMGTIEFSHVANDDIDQQIAKDPKKPPAAINSGAWKHWILSKRLTESPNPDCSHSGEVPGGPSAAINYGGWKKDGTVAQSEGACHNDEHSDYSQDFQPVARYAKDSNGKTIDLLDWIEQNESVPAKYTAAFR